MASAKTVSKIHQRVLDKNRLALSDEPKIAKNTFWDDAQDHYRNSLAAIVQVEATLRDELVEFTRDRVKLDLIEDQQGLANNINILTKDISEHVNRLNNIYAKHKDKHGSTITPDEHMELLHIHGEYADALEIYQANIVPTTAYILEQISIVEKKLLEQNSITDPTVITDVEVKPTVEG